MTCSCIFEVSSSLERGVRTLASMCACSSSTATSSDVEKMFVCIYLYTDTTSLSDHTQPAAN